MKKPHFHFLRATSLVNDVNEETRTLHDDLEFITLRAFAFLSTRSIITAEFVPFEPVQQQRSSELAEIIGKPKFIIKQ